MGVWKVVSLSIIDFCHLFPFGKRNPKRGMAGSPGFKHSLSCTEAIPVSKSHSHCIHCLRECQVPQKCTFCLKLKSRARKNSQLKLRFLMMESSLGLPQNNSSQHTHRCPHDITLRWLQRGNLVILRKPQKRELQVPRLKSWPGKKDPWQNRPPWYWPNCDCIPMKL